MYGYDYTYSTVIQVIFSWLTNFLINKLTKISRSVNRSNLINLPFLAFCKCTFLHVFPYLGLRCSLKGPCGVPYFYPNSIALSVPHLDLAMGSVMAVAV